MKDILDQFTNEDFHELAKLVYHTYGDFYNEVTPKDGEDVLIEYLKGEPMWDEDRIIVHDWLTKKNKK